jgi:hypothetical protein
VISERQRGGDDDLRLARDGRCESAGDQLDA